MDDSGTPTWAHFCSSGNGNSQDSSSTFAGAIPVSPNDDPFFQDVDTTGEQQHRDTYNIDEVTQASSASCTVPVISRPTQGLLVPTFPQTMFGLQPIYLQSVMMVLVQRLYQSGLPLEHLRAVPRIYYGGFNLQDAFSEDFDGLQDSDQLAWTDDIRLPPKLAIVLLFSGYPIYKHQVTILRAHNQPPSRGILARILAREMKRFLDKARTEYRQPFCWQGRELSLSDLFLIDIEQVSRGSLQPRIGTRGTMGRPPCEFVHDMNAFSPVPSVTY